MQNQLSSSPACVHVFVTFAQPPIQGEVFVRARVMSQANKATRARMRAHPHTHDSLLQEACHFRLQRKHHGQQLMLPASKEAIVSWIAVCTGGEIWRA